MGATEGARRREVNDGRRRIFAVAGRPIAFVCECGEPHCTRTIVLTDSEYDERRTRDGVLLAHDPAAPRSS
jgi:hypothetical protein